MGHYRVEMIHDGEEPEPDPPNTNFIVTDGYCVMTVDEFDAEHRATAAAPRLLNPLIYRAGKQEFSDRYDAEVHAREMCEADVEAVRQKLSALKNVLKVQRPWEKK